MFHLFLFMYSYGMSFALDWRNANSRTAGQQGRPKGLAQPSGPGRSFGAGETWRNMGRHSVETWSCRICHGLLK